MNINKISLRFAIVGGIAITLLFPLAMIQGLVDEREAYYHTATQGVTDGWGNAQDIVGPLLLIPRHRSSNGWTVQDEPGTSVVLLAHEVNAEIEVLHEIRRRGIFEIPVYVANVSLAGSFDRRAWAEQKDLDWSRAQMLFGISDTHGIRNVMLQVADQQHELQPMAHHDWFEGGLQTDLALGDAEDVAFTLSLSLRGSTSLSAIFPAANSQLNMASSWPHPSFRGRFLPDTLSTSAEGFSASWANHELSRGFPQQWAAASTAGVLRDKGIKVDLYEPVSVYRSVERGVKYGVLFLAVTFLTLLCFELATGLRFHFVQYAAAGLAMLVFFLALLSLSEHLNFAVAYTMATLAMVSLTGWYVSRITHTLRLAAIFVAVLVSVYCVLFMLLRMEAYALVAGTVVVIAGLAALMWTTQGLTERTIAAHADASSKA